MVVLIELTWHHSCTVKWWLLLFVVRCGVDPHVYARGGTSLSLVSSQASLFSDLPGAGPFAHVLLVNTYLDSPQKSWRGVSTSFQLRWDLGFLVKHGSHCIWVELSALSFTSVPEWRAVWQSQMPRICFPDLGSFRTWFITVSPFSMFLCLCYFCNESGLFYYLLNHFTFHSKFFSELSYWLKTFFFIELTFT